VSERETSLCATAVKNTPTSVWQMLKKYRKMPYLGIGSAQNLPSNQFQMVTPYPCLPSLVNIHQRIHELSCRHADTQIHTWMITVPICRGDQVMNLHCPGESISMSYSCFQLITHAMFPQRFYTLNDNTVRNLLVNLTVANQVLWQTQTLPTNIVDACLPPHCDDTSPILHRQRLSMQSTVQITC